MLVCCLVSWAIPSSALPHLARNMTTGKTSGNSPDLLIPAASVATYSLLAALVCATGGQVIKRVRVRGGSGPGTASVTRTSRDSSLVSRFFRDGGSMGLSIGVLATAIGCLLVSMRTGKL